MKILVAGDFCQRYRVDDAIRNKRYSNLFDEIKPIIVQADYAIVNFEFPIVINPAEAKPILKCGPNLQGTIESVEAVKYAGFSCCTLANNHILDQGEKCCLDTKRELEIASVDTVGVGNNLKEASEILYKKIYDETLAIINCCEHEFSIATEASAGANPLNPVNQFYKIQEARNNADFVLVIVHGGHEHYQLPSISMQETYRFFVDAGADAVVNHHQHCYSGYEVYKGKPIFYGIGNFCFDEISQRDTMWNEGYTVTIDFNKDRTPSFEIVPHEQCGESFFLKLLKEKAQFEDQLSWLNTIIRNREEIQRQWHLFEEKNRTMYRQVLYPHNSRIIRAMDRLRLFPINKAKCLFLCAVVQCESHRLRLLQFLRNIY